MTSRSLALTWQSSPCLPSYHLELCTEDHRCHQAEVQAHHPEVQHLFSDLEPCTEYTLSLLPLMEGGKPWQGGPLEVGM